MNSNALQIISEKIEAYNSIVYLQWHLTDSCEEQCKHCYLSNERQELSVAENILILNKAVDFACRKDKPLFVAFTGGDPLLYHGIWELLDYCKKREIGVLIKGNPHLINTDLNLAKQLNQYGIISYQLSLDGSEKYHDHQRSIGSYQKTLSALQKLQQANITTVVKMTVSPQNYTQVGLLTQKMDTLQVDYVGLSRIVCTGNAKKTKPQPYLLING